MQALERRHGDRAVSFARSVIEERVGGGDGEPPTVVDGALAADRGAFVTLAVDGSLRGCIGRPYPTQPAHRAIRESAVGAAVGDPRFRPVSPDELATVTVEVSLLSDPEPVSRPAESVDVGRHGLIVDADERRGLLLPQVAADREWETTRFLAETCRKAGLDGDCWRGEDVGVERFTASVYAEREPRGPIVPVALGESAMARS
ncbi:MAG: AmmeMemoRadiSam system protein A [Halanaeroarchaeum sp.]